MEVLARLLVRRPLAGAATLLAGLVACGSEPHYVEPPPAAVTVATPDRDSVTDYLEVTGTVVSVETVEIRARVEGFLQSIEFVEGDLVEEGALLYRIDPAEYQAREDHAKAAQNTANAALTLASATLKRREKAFESGAVSELEVLENRAHRDVAVASLQAAEAELRTAQLDLSYTEIRAPTSGRVGRSMIDKGNLVGAQEKTLLTTLVRYDPIYAYFSISEREVLRLAPSSEADEARGNQAREINDLPIELGRSTDVDYPLQGKLDFVDLGIDPETGTYQLRAVFQNPAPVKLIPGLFVRGRIPLREREDVLLVSERALGSDQSGRYVLVVDDQNVTQYRSVEVGALVEGRRVIEKGLAPTDRIVTKGVMFARPGAKVDPRPESEEPATPAGTATEGPDSPPRATSEAPKTSQPSPPAED